MVALATYLGHVNIDTTYWYLETTPPLCGVGRRPRARWQRLSLFARRQEAAPACKRARPGLLAGFCEGCIDRRMPRMQIYLPEAMYKQVKARGLPVSELLQKAVEAELRRQDLLAETDRYLEDLVAEVGAPSPGQRARAGAVVRRMVQRAVRKVG
jgi:hypothetical protein